MRLRSLTVTIHAALSGSGSAFPNLCMYRNLIFAFLAIASVNGLVERKLDTCKKCLE